MSGREGPRRREATIRRDRLRTSLVAVLTLALLADARRVWGMQDTTSNRHDTVAEPA